MPIVPSGYANVVCKFDLIGSNRDPAITFGIRLDGALFGQVRVEAIRDAVEARLMPPVSSNIILTSVEMKIGPGESGPTFVAPTNEPGGASGSGMTPNVAYLFKKRTNLGGRKNRGRFYMPGVTESPVDSVGAIEAPTLAVLQTAANNFLADLAAADSPMVVLHNDVTTPTEVSSLIVDPRVATQRRRLR